MQLVAKDLACDRGGRRVFSNLSFSVEAGKLLEITGANGTGKSTLLRLIAGLSEPVSGSVDLEGGDPELDLPQQVHFIAHQDAIKPALTALENLRFWERFFGGGELGEALGCFDLEPLADHPAALLSEGQKRRLALSRLALFKRPIWLLDEPTVGLDSRSRDRLMELISAHLAARGLVLVSTHVPLGLEPHVIVKLG
ncbi:MAG: heme ABC exporter ATP-binding protein CcmA [Hyphomicrobiales bacterium]